LPPASLFPYIGQFDASRSKSRQLARHTYARLKDTGRKLAHFDRELNAGRTPIPPHLHREELN